MMRKRTPQQKMIDYMRMYGASEIMVGRMVGQFPPPLGGWTEIELRVIAEWARATKQ